MPPVSNSRADMNMQMRERAATGGSHVNFQNQSAVFRLKELTIIVGSSVFNALQHLKGGGGLTVFVP